VKNPEGLDLNFHCHEGIISLIMVGCLSQCNKFSVLSNFINLYFSATACIFMQFVYRLFY
jgi:hypothetical protein